MNESGAVQHRLHNMSAPPRMRLTLRALIAPQVRRAGLLGLFGRGHGPVHVANDMRCIGCSGFPADRFSRADPVVALLDVLGETGAQSGEEATDRLVASLAALRPAALGLPPFALAVTLSDPGQPAPWTAPELTAKQALALLSRTAGGVFLAGRSPRLAVGEWLQCRYAWFLPLGRNRS